ncbi:MAG: hypothetical protein LBE13_13940, partial [Bacteroidales bacterium]|nr:hypothetical protein [Bacteroidales bacterium]
LYDEIYKFTLSLQDVNEEEIMAEKEKLMIQGNVWFDWIWLSDKQFKKFIDNDGDEYIVFRDYWDDKLFNGARPEY